MIKAFCDTCKVEFTKYSKPVKTIIGEANGLPVKLKFDIDRNDNGPGMICKPCAEKIINGDIEYILEETDIRWVDAIVYFD